MTAAATAADAGVLSLAPALVAIVLAFWTRQVLLALLCGVLTGSAVVLLTGGGDANPISRFLVPAVGSESFAQILLIYLWCLGGLIGMWSKTGGARHFAEVVGHRIVRGPRTAQLFAWVVGAVFHQGGTVSAVLAGTTVKPVTDRHRISHEELSYIVDATASPAATVIPFNAWPFVVGGMAVGSAPIEAFVDGEAAAGFFFRAVPFNFYGILTMLGTLGFALGVWPALGRRMRAARQRARATGALDAPGAEPLLRIEQSALRASEGYTPSLWDFFVPIGVLIGVAVVPYTLGRLGVLEDGNWINEAFCLSVLAAMLTAGGRGMRLTEILGGFVGGCQAMTIGALVLALAVTLGKVSRDLDAAGYLAGLFGESIGALWLPALLGLVSMLIAFSTGTAWGTYAVVMPIAMGLAWAIQPDEAFLAVCFGAVVGAGVFGDQCSPISDTTILSSMFTGCDLMDHVRTQLPQALCIAAAGLVATTLATLGML